MNAVTRADGSRVSWPTIGTPCPLCSARLSAEHPLDEVERRHRADRHRIHNCTNCGDEFTCANHHASPWHWFCTRCLARRIP